MVFQEAKNCHFIDIEAEFVAATACACQAIWLRKFLKNYNSKKKGATIIFCDNNSAIKLSINPVLHGRSKHIDVKNYFLRDLNNEGTVELQYCQSEDQLADIFTKPLRCLPFKKLRRLMGINTMEEFKKLKLNRSLRVFSLREGVSFNNSV